MRRFWPGPLTLLLPKGPNVPDVVTAGQPTVGVRLPAHPVARCLIQLCGFPLAAPSANSSGNPSPTLASHVFQDLRGKIPLIIDGGPSESGIESTVIDVMRNPPVILRPGGVTVEQVREVIPSVLVYNSKGFAASKEMEDKPSTPGMKYRHYSPKAKVVLFEGEDYGKVREAIGEELRRLNEGRAEDGGEVAASGNQGTDGPNNSQGSQASQGSGRMRYGLVVTHKDANYGDFRERHEREETVGRVNVFCRLGVEERLDEVAQGLFKMLRDMDDAGVGVILIEGVSEEHEGLAVMNRLRKAASRRVIVS